jgi:hypothetical protein
MKVKLTLGDQTVEADKMDFNPIQENWSIYRLEDGTIIKLKLIISDVFRIPGTDPVTGVPQFMVRSTNIMSVEPAVQTPKTEVH